MRKLNFQVAGILLLALLLGACSGTDADTAPTDTSPAQTATTANIAGSAASDAADETTASPAAPGSADLPAAADTAPATTASSEAADDRPADTSPASATSSGADAAHAEDADRDAEPASDETADTAQASSDAESADAEPAGAQAQTELATDNSPWVAGKNYFVLQPQQPRLHNNDKVEVVEVFSYGCPACHQAQPYVRKLAKSLPDYARMGYLPVSFNAAENFPMYQRAFYTAKVFGVARKAQDAMFQAVWVDHSLATYDPETRRPKPRDEWPTMQDVAQFYAQYGVDPKEFVAASKSFGVDTKMKRADEMIKNWGVRSTPTIVIDGKYRLTPNSAGSYDKMIALTKWLAQKEQKATQAEG